MRGRPGHRDVAGYSFLQEFVQKVGYGDFQGHLFVRVAAWERSRVLLFVECSNIHLGREDNSGSRDQFGQVDGCVSAAHVRAAV